MQTQAAAVRAPPAARSGAAGTRARPLEAFHRAGRAIGPPSAIQPSTASARQPSRKSSVSTRTLTGAGGCRGAPRPTSRAKAAISRTFWNAKAGSANGARAASAGNAGKRSISVATPRIAIEPRSPGTTTPTAGRFAITRAFSVPRPMPNHSRSGVAANSSGVTCGPLDVSTARDANDAASRTGAILGLRSAFTRSGDAGLHRAEVGRAEAAPVARGHVDEFEVDPARRALARQVREHPGPVLDVDHHHLALARDREVRDRQRVPPGLGVRHEDVQLRALARTDARGRRDVHAGVADRGRHRRERTRRVLDVDDEVDHPCAP